MVPSVPMTSSRKSIPPAKRPTHFELPYSAVRVFYEFDRMVLRFDGMHLGICPTHDLKGFDVLPYKITANLHTMASEIYDGTSTGFLLVPKPTCLFT